MLVSLMFWLQWPFLDQGQECTPWRFAPSFSQPVTSSRVLRQPLQAPQSIEHDHLFAGPNSRIPVVCPFPLLKGCPLNQQQIESDCGADTRTIRGSRLPHWQAEAAGPTMLHCPKH